ncbi:hypothetical protein VST7929_01704 [Vibrio stylophorae]|uniref:WD40 repeat domain-containing protein n=1 Tax=Vibrio stylophorae TaxID=659351 RepID=A0ABM8ZU37_9VIBR|nr:hypothetical protein [Vibrio stylophorae]CAH0533829.1 hypothetical protein VST7929_01704 [Vibrio stylophorae]
MAYHSNNWRQIPQYVATYNRFLEQGYRDGWEGLDEPDDPPSCDLEFPAFLDAIIYANQVGDLTGFRDAWPLAYAPLCARLNELGQSIPMLAVFDDGKILARLGTTYQSGHAVLIDGDKVQAVADIGCFGQSANGQWLAIAGEHGVVITRGWQGEMYCVCPYPSALQMGVALDEPWQPEKLVPFDDGRAVLFVSAQGCFILEPQQSIRLLPTNQACEDHFQWLAEDCPEVPQSLPHLDMVHGAVSSDGQWIAVGSQCSAHLVFDRQGNQVAEIGPHSEYPHFALFSAKDEQLLLNACHFYNGASISVPCPKIPGLYTDFYQEHADITVVEQAARVYAGVARKDEYIIGDAYGWLRCVDFQGQLRWIHHIGSTIDAMVLSADGQTLICSSYAGFISILELDSDARAPYELGFGPVHESRRWLFWKNMQPLMW